MSLERIKKELNQKFGAGTLVTASDAHGLKINRFSTGSLSLDIALGGGFAEGRINELVGQYSSYKSTLATLSCQCFLNKSDTNDILWIDMEKSFDTKWARKLGLDLKRVHLCVPASGEEAIDIACETLSQYRASDDRHVLIVVDSIAAMTPSAESENSAEKGFIGAAPRLIAKFMRKVISLMRSDLKSDVPKNTFLLLNQIRMMVGLLFGNPEVAVGGKALEHAASIRVNLRKKGFIFEESGAGDDKIKRAVGANIGFTVVKNKTSGGVQEKGLISFYNEDFNHMKGGTIDQASDLISLGVVEGFIQRKKNSYLMGKIKAGSREKFCAKLNANPKYLKALAKELRLIRHPENASEKEIDL